MARVLDTNLATRVDQKLGTKPLLIVDCYWTAVSLISYADKDYDYDPTGAPRIKGQLVSVSGLENIINLTGGNNISITVTLTDVDGIIKDLMKNNNIHKRPVVIRHAYTDLSPNAVDTIVLAYGFIYTPIVYNPVERTITFRVSSKLEDREVGFSPEQGQFEFLDDKAIGVPWPLCFGLVRNVPAVKVNARRVGQNLTKYSIITLKEIEEFKEKCRKYVDLLMKKEAVDTLKTQINPQDVVKPEEILSVEEYQDLVKELVTAQSEITEIYNELVLFKPDSTTALTNLFGAMIRGHRYISALKQLNKTKLELEEALETQKRKAAVIPTDVNGVLFGPDQIIQSNIQNIPNLLVNVENDILYVQELVDIEQENIEVYTTECLTFTLTEIRVNNGRTFPQNETITILVKGKAFEGQMNVDTFTITNSNMSTHEAFTLDERESTEPSHFWVENSSIKLKGMLCFITKENEPNRIVYVKDQVGRRCIFTPILFNERLEGNQPIYDVVTFDETYTVQKTNPVLPIEWLSEEDNATTINTTKPGVFTGYNKDLQSTDWTIDVGDEVTLYNDYWDTYIANCVPADYIPATDVYAVMAYREIKNKRQLVPIPSSYYNVRENELLDSLRVAAVEFPTPLKDYDEGWEDQHVYVTLRSNLPTNPANVIKFLIEKYSNLQLNQTSFTTAVGFLTYFKANFALLERGNVLRLIEEIAWQAKCKVYVKNSVYYIKYIAHQDPDAFSYTESDLLDVEVGHTSTEEIITVFEAEYRTEYAEEKPHKLILRNNILIYGQHKETYPFYIYTDRKLVEHVATFWLIRYSNTWKRARFVTPLHTLRVEPYDIIGVTLNSDIVVSGEFHVEIETVIYNPNDLTLEYEGWIPVRTGESTQYLFAYTYDVSELTPFPYPGLDLYVGGNNNGYNISTGGNFQFTNRAIDWGKLYPSDLSLTILPDDPAVPTQMDYQIKDKRKVETTSSKVILPLEQTFVRDEHTGTEAPLDSMLAVVRGNKDRVNYEHIANDFENMRGYLSLNASKLRIAQGITGVGYIRDHQPSESDPIWPLPATQYIGPDNPNPHYGNIDYSKIYRDWSNTREQVSSVIIPQTGRINLCYDHITREYFAGQIIEQFWAIITSYQVPFGLQNRWLYEWEEISLYQIQSNTYYQSSTTDQSLVLNNKRRSISSNSQTLAVNILEINNVNNVANDYRIQGNSSWTGTNGTQTRTLLPVGGQTIDSNHPRNNPVVLMHRMRRMEDSKIIYVFQYENFTECTNA